MTATGSDASTDIKRRGQDQLLVAVKFLQQEASVAIEDFLLEPIG